MIEKFQGRRGTLEIKRGISYEIEQHIRIRSFGFAFSSLTAHAQHTATYPCESWSDAWEQRCSADKGPGNTAYVTIRNYSFDQITLQYDEWHSSCGWGGGKVFSEIIILPPKAPVPMLPSGTAVMTMSYAAELPNCSSNPSLSVLS